MVVEQVHDFGVGCRCSESDAAKGGAATLDQRSLATRRDSELAPVTERVDGGFFQLNFRA